METKATKADYERLVKIVTEALAAGTPGITAHVENDSGQINCDEAAPHKRNYGYSAATAQTGSTLDAPAVVERVRAHWRAQGYKVNNYDGSATAQGTTTLGMTVDDFSFQALVPEGGHVLSITGSSPCR